MSDGADPSATGSRRADPSATEDSWRGRVDERPENLPVDETLPRGREARALLIDLLRPFRFAVAALAVVVVIENAARLAIPLITIVFSIGAFSLGYALRGTNLILNKIAIIELPLASIGNNSAPITSYLGLFSSLTTILRN